MASRNLPQWPKPGAWNYWRTNDGTYAFNSSNGLSRSKTDDEVFGNPCVGARRLELYIDGERLHVVAGAYRTEDVPDSIIASRPIPETWEEVVSWARVVAAIVYSHASAEEGDNG